MAFSFKFFHDSALTQPVASGTPLTASQDTALSLPPTDKIIYFGSTVAANKAQVFASPGAAAIQVNVVDENNLSGAAVGEFKLSLSSAGLASAVAGAALVLAPTVNGGAGSAVPIYTRRTPAVSVVGSYTDISLNTQELVETTI